MSTRVSTGRGSLRKCQSSSFNTALTGVCNRNIHVVSLVHAIIIVVLAYRALNQPSLIADPLFGWHALAELTSSVAVGYVFTSCHHGPKIPTDTDCPCAPSCLRDSVLVGISYGTQ